MPPHQGMRQPQSLAHSPDLVLVQVGEGLDHEAFLDERVDLRDPIVVRLDFVGVLGAPAFDGVSSLSCSNLLGT